MARAAKTLLSLGAPDCPVRQAGAGQLAALGNSTAPYDYNSPDCPVSQRSAAQSACDAWPGQRSDGGTGLFGVHRTVSGAPTAPERQRSALPKKERNPHRTVSGGAPDCPVRQAKAGIAFLECTQRLLATLGLEKGPLGAWRRTPSIL